MNNPDHIDNAVRTMVERYRSAWHAGDKERMAQYPAERERLEREYGEDAVRLACRRFEENDR